MPSLTRARRGGAALVVSILLVSIGSGLFLPLSIVYFVALTEVPLPLLGVLLTAANAITIPLPLLAGRLADRIGALPVVIGAQVLQGVSFLGYTQVTGPAGVFLTAAMGAIGVRFFWSSIFTLIADYADHTTDVRRDLWYARASIARTVGIGAGGLMTGLVIADGRDVAYRGIALAGAGCFALGAIALLVFLRLPGPDRAVATTVSGYRDLLSDRPFLAFTVLNSCAALSTLMLGLTLPTFVRTAMGGPAWLPSVVLVGNATLVAALGTGLTRRLVRYRRTRVLCAAAALWSGWGLALGLIARGHGTWAVAVLIVATLLFTVAEVMHAATSMAIAAAVAPLHARGRYLALFQYSFVIAEVVAPVFFTALFSLDQAAPFLALAVINIVAIGWILRLEPRLPPHALRQPPNSEASAHGGTATPRTSPHSARSPEPGTHARS